MCLYVSNIDEARNVEYDIPIGISDNDAGCVFLARLPCIDEHKMDRSAWNIVELPDTITGKRIERCGRRFLVDQWIISALCTCQSCHMEFVPSRPIYLDVVGFSEVAVNLEPACDPGAIYSEHTAATGHAATAWR